MQNEITNYHSRKNVVDTKDSIPLGIISYNFDKETEKTFTYKSRGKK